MIKTNYSYSFEKNNLHIITKPLLPKMNRTKFHQKVWSVKGLWGSCCNVRCHKVKYRKSKYEGTWWFYTFLSLGMEWRWIYATYVHSKTRLANHFTSKYGLQKKDVSSQYQPCGYCENRHTEKVNFPSSKNWIIQKLIFQAPGVETFTPTVKSQVVTHLV